MSEPKITKFVVKKQQESNTIEIHKDQDMHCEVCDVKGSFWIGGNCTLCLPCIKGLAKIAKELK